jgi:phenylpropionate dioxygenase-like ring-hydroxylating dioxygenase large terminal subunit
MYINFWYPTLPSRDLAHKPVRVRILNHDLVVFRDSAGTAHTLSDTCVHRGGSLAGGKVLKDNCIQCPYHGWRYNGDGICTRIPSLGMHAKIPPRARVDAYPTEEKYGVVFAFLGDLPEEQRAPIMEIPEYGHAEWRAQVATFDVNVNYERSIENGLDPAHNEFVHPTHGFSGERESEYKVNELNPIMSDWGFGFMNVFKAPPLKSRVLRAVKKTEGEMEAGTGHHGPNQMWTYIHFTPTKKMHQYVYEAPIDERHIRVFLVNLRNIVITRYEWLNRLIDRKIHERNMVVAGQDVLVLEKIKPVLTPPSTAKELLMPADKVIFLYREKLKEWEQKGWRIDIDALNGARQRGDVEYVIPSPARRLSKGWVLDPVPLVPPTQSETATIRAAM